MADIHYHQCPECFEKWPCELDCTIDTDLDDPIGHPDKKFGSHCVCSLCDKDEYNTVWYAKYNGFTR
jgi:hypothetical protein